MATKKQSNPEGVLAKKIIAKLRNKGWECLRLQAGLVRGFTGGLFQLCSSGTPDWVCLRPSGKLFFLETKAPKKKLRQSQVDRILQLQGDGYVVVVTSSDVLFYDWYRANIGEDL